MQVGEREGGQLCDTHYKDVSKTVILMWQRGQGVANFESYLNDVICECPLIALKKVSSVLMYNTQKRL